MKMPLFCPTNLYKKASTMYLHVTLFFLELFLSEFSGQHDDARMNLSMTISAVRHGGSLVNYTELIELHKSKDENGK